jgi:hypothetical protein
MSECYDCGELFDGFGDCPRCGSQNIGTVEREGSSFADEYYSEERFPSSFDEDEDLSEDRMDDDLITDALFPDSDDDKDEEADDD